VSLTDAAESRVLNWLFENTTTAPSGALKLKLMTANGDETTAGTEVTGGSYAAPTVTPSSSAAGSAATTASDIVITGMPTSKTVNAGDDFKIPAGSMSFTAD